jgi:hypothetical protein
MVLSKGARIIRPVLITTVILMAARLLLEQRAAG